MQRVSRVVNSSSVPEVCSSENKAPGTWLVPYGNAPECAGRLQLELVSCGKPEGQLQPVDDRLHLLDSAQYMLGVSG